ncbi:MAG: CheW domain protein [Rickettsiaceae bacterium]|jgi:purine-binding chemotaxis protein CheW|nr:CheW domain protein [Burkholderiales bacterium]MCE3232680.1 CheW domain protein [Rickettsiaceae bacterium]MCE3269404.1 CheW domain protein [Burkholderiales bacterium]
MGNLVSYIATSPALNIAPTEQYLIIQLDNQFFAIEAKFIIEISNAQTVTPVPLGPNSIIGLMNFREQVIPVVNIRAKLGLTNKTINDCKSITMTYEGNAYTFIVDKVGDLLDLVETEISNGMYTLHNNQVIILSIDTLLATS